MAKLTTMDKIQIYIKRQNGHTLTNLCEEYKIDKSTAKYLIALIKRHGYEIFTKKKSVRYSDELKRSAVNRVLIGKEPIKAVAIDLGLSSGATLRNWINNFN